MNTKETEKKVESTSATTESKTSDNKKTFGPLGKYAVVAIIMVSIIVTTAIMLNKQLGSVNEQLAVMETEAAEIYAANSTDAVASEATIKTPETAEATETEATPVEVQTAEVQAVEVQAVEAPSAEVLVATENTVKETVSEAIISTEQTSSTDVAVIAPAMDKNSAEDDQPQLAMAKRDQERQARIESFKLEQKQHMAEMFARIKTLEAQQLDNYKSYQDKQIERLRQQIARQEQMIEELIVRNEDRFDMRAASMQRSQSNRAEMLNRI